MRNRKIIFTIGSLFKKDMLKSVSIQKLDSCKGDTSDVPDEGDEGSGEDSTEGGGETPNPGA